MWIDNSQIFIFGFEFMIVLIGNQFMIIKVDNKGIKLFHNLLGPVINHKLH